MTYKASTTRQKLGNKYLSDLCSEHTQIRKTLEKYESDNRTSENDELALRRIHDYFIRLEIILIDAFISMEWEQDILLKVTCTKIKYRTAIVDKQSSDQNKTIVLNELQRREQIAKETHQEYLCDIREP